MDLDRYGKPPFDNLPRNWNDAVLKYTDVFIIDANDDTLQLLGNGIQEIDKRYITVKNKVWKKLTSRDSIQIDYKKYKDYYMSHIIEKLYDDENTLDKDSLVFFLKQETGTAIKCKSAFFVDRLSEHGILPYNLVRVMRQLTKAFEDKDNGKVLRYSAEIGHYIGDAHVPLHTTENYNGKLTKQDGIHGFWESRIPELFADDNYDCYVGKAEIVEKPEKYFWNIVLESHSLVDSVLLIEKALSQTFERDKQFCYENRLEATIRTYCRDYAAAYHNRMNGMVEDRFRKAILSVGSVWHTCWILAGSPDMSDWGEYKESEAEKAEKAELEKKAQGGKMIGREEH